MEKLEFNGTRGPWVSVGETVSLSDGSKVTQNYFRHEDGVAEANAQAISAIPEFIKSSKQFTEEWDHFLDKVNIGSSFLDARAVRFMNEVPGLIKQALNKSLGQ